MVKTTDNTSREAHFRRVPYTHTVQRFAQRQEAVTINAHETIALETVTFLNYLQRESGVKRHTDTEVTGHVGLNRLTALLHNLAVEKDIRIAHRHGRQFV